MIALGALLVAPVPCRAAGLGADVVVSGQAHFTVYGGDRASYLIDVTAQASEAGTRSGTGAVTVTIRRCAGLGCSRRYTYTGAVPASSFSVAEDLSSGRLSTRLFGRPLDVVWSAPQSSTLPSYELSPDGPRVGARLYDVTHASGALLGLRCSSSDGLVSREALVAAEPVVSASLPRALPRALAGLAHGSC